MTDESLHRRLLAIASAVGGPLMAMDTSGPTASICTVGWGGEAVAELDLPAGALPSESLAQTLVDAMARTDLQAGDLRGIVIGLGPGSYTGLRVGLATAKGIAFGADVPLYGTSSLAMLAAAHGPGMVAPVVDARRSEVFGALYDVNEAGDAEPIIQDAAFSPAGFVARLDEIYSGSLLAVGTGAATCWPSGLPTGMTVLSESTTRAAYGILHVEDRIRQGEADSLDKLTPRYLKEWGQDLNN